MKTQTPLLLILLVFLFGACASTSRSNAHDDVRTVSLGQMTDWAAKCRDAIVSQEFLREYQVDNGRAVIAIGDFINNSRRMDVGEDKEVFINQLTKQLVNSGKITVTRLYAGSAGRRDSVTVASKELEDDDQFDKTQGTRFADKALKARLVLSLVYNQKKTNGRSGSDVYENFMHIEFIDQQTKSVVYSDDVPLDKS